MRTMSGTCERVSAASAGAVFAMLALHPGPRSAAASIESPMRSRPSVSYTLRTSISARFCAFSVSSMTVGWVAFGSVRGWIATGSVYMKPGGGAATIRNVCLAGSTM